MASIVISGDTSGAVTLSAPAISGTTTLTLPTTSGTLVVTGGAQTVQFAAGSAAAPSITFTGDTNTGIFSPAADTIAFSEGGVESMRIDASGNVGIGTTSPQARLHVGGAILYNGSISEGTNLTTVSSSGTNLQFGLGSTWTSNIFYTGGSERMRIDSSGNVGIGTSSPVSIGAGYGTIDVRGSNGGGYRWGSSANNAYTFCDSNGLIMATASSLPLVLQTNNTERMRIDSAGRVTTPNQPAFLASRATSTQTNMVAGTVCIFNSEIYDEGGNYNPSNGVFTAPVTGKYLFTAVTLFRNITAGQDIDAILSTSNRGYYACPGRFEVAVGVTWSNDYMAYGYYQIADMDANDTAFIQITMVSSGTIGLHEGPEWTRFAGYLLG